MNHTIQSASENTQPESHTQKSTLKHYTRKLILPTTSSIKPASTIIRGVTAGAPRLARTTPRNKLQNPMSLFNIISVNNKTEVLIGKSIRIRLDKIASRYLAKTKFIAHLIRYASIAASHFELQSEIFCRALHDSEAGQLNFEISFIVRGDVEDLLDKEFKFRKELIKELPSSVRQKFVLSYQISES